MGRAAALARCERGLDLLARAGDHAAERHLLGALAPKDDAGVGGARPSPVASGGPSV